MEAVAYVRVSSKAQDYKTQRAAIERAADARGDRIVRWYSEKLSGRTLARAELERLRQAARAGEVRAVYVFKLDRLTRSGIRDTLEVVEELRTAGAGLVTVADGFTLDGPAADVILAVMAWAAKMERLATAERIAAARQRVEAEGGRWGRPRVMDKAVVKQAVALRKTGLSVRDVAEQLGQSKSAVDRALRRSA
jgi:DNA invertase Pin-like site-specific DNA recombinase